MFDATVLHLRLKLWLGKAWFASWEVHISAWLYVELERQLKFTDKTRREAWGFDIILIVNWVQLVVFFYYALERNTRVPWASLAAETAFLPDYETNKKALLCEFRFVGIMKMNPELPEDGRNKCCPFLFSTTIFSFNYKVVSPTRGYSRVGLRKERCLYKFEMEWSRQSEIRLWMRSSPGLIMPEGSRVTRVLCHCCTDNFDPG